MFPGESFTQLTVNLLWILYSLPILATPSHFKHPQKHSLYRNESIPETYSKIEIITYNHFDTKVKTFPVSSRNIFCNVKC